MNELKKPWLSKWGTGDRLSGGGQGETFAVPNRANPDGVLKVIVDAKKLDRKARGRMSSEITNLKIMRSNGATVPEVFEANPEDISDLETELYYVMEFIPGQTLAELIKTRNGLNLEESVNVCLALTRTLRIAHEIPILHRDLKPENVMVRNLESLDVVMLDFGISFHGNDGPNLTSHAESFRNGLIHLPERTGIAADQRNFRSDLTDVVAILYFCLSAQPPRNLEDEHGHQIHISNAVQLKLRQRCKDESQLRKLNQFFSRGFQKDISSRFKSADELEERLLGLLSPITHTTNEDLDLVLKNSVEQLKNDRKTRIRNFKDKIQDEIQRLEQSLSELPLPVVTKQHGSFRPNLMELDYSLPNKIKDKTFVLLTMNIFERVRENSGNERVYFYQLALHNTANEITFLIEYEFQLVGSECVINRIIREAVMNSRKQIVELEEKFSSPEGVRLDPLINDVRTAVGICVEMIREKLQSV